ncbi:MAG: tetratricopeptide repeat protein [Myxococcales bacterium]|nr:tetratricopeptide repeat protein [Myxococcales bacterium]
MLFDDLDDDEILAELRGETKPSAVAAAPPPAAPSVWTPSATATYTPTGPATGGPPAGPTAVYSPAPSSAAASSAAAITQLTEGLPRDPPEQCQPPPDALRSESRKQVMTGDDLRLAKDASGAIQKYRAAISMDSCNGYGWIGLGESAILLGRPDLAVRTLRNATMLMPQHYGAWLELGQAYESINEVEAAISSYQRALAVKPGLAGAVDGLARLGVR